MKKMKKRYFEQWYHVYWQSRIEWKLNIRADCHNKYAVCFAIANEGTVLYQQQCSSCSKEAIELGTSIL